MIKCLFCLFLHLMALMLPTELQEEKSKLIPTSTPNLLKKDLLNDEILKTQRKLNPVEIP